VSDLSQPEPKREPYEVGTRIAVYPGTFDPPTLGHLDIIERAAHLFDELIVAVGVNSSKSPLLSVDQRLDALSELTSKYPNVQVATFKGLLADYCRSVGAHSIVRGLRAVADFEYEFQIAMANRKLNPDVDSVFLMTSWEYSFLSSSVVREVATLGGDISSMVPPSVAKLLESVVATRNTQA